MYRTLKYNKNIMKQNSQLKETTINHKIFETN